MNKFKTRLKELRAEKGLTQTKVAQDLGYHHSSIVKWEQGKQEPKISMLIKIADYFNVTVGYLVGAED